MCSAVSVCVQWRVAFEKRSFSKECLCTCEGSPDTNWNQKYQRRAFGFPRIPRVSNCGLQQICFFFVTIFLKRKLNFRTRTNIMLHSASIQVPLTPRMESNNSQERGPRGTLDHTDATGDFWHGRAGQFKMTKGRRKALHNSYQCV